MRRHKNKVILFDCGDTLIHLHPSKERILTNFLKDKGVKTRIKDVKNAYQIIDFCFKQPLSIQNDFRKKKDFLIKYNLALFKILGLEEHSASWAKDLFKRFQESKQWILFPDTVLCLDSLKKANFTLGVVANWNDKLPALLQELKIKQYFSVIVSSAVVQSAKPDSKIFQSAIKQLNIASFAAFYIGNDYEMDVVGARRLKLNPILIDRNGNFPYADCLKFSNLSEMTKYLLKG